MMRWWARGRMRVGSCADIVSTTGVGKGGREE